MVHRRRWKHRPVKNDRLGWRGLRSKIETGRVHQRLRDDFSLLSRDRRLGGLVDQVVDNGVAIVQAKAGLGSQRDYASR